MNVVSLCIRSLSLAFVLGRAFMLTLLVAIDVALVVF